MRSTAVRARRTGVAQASGLAALLLVVGLGASACGGEDDGPLSAQQLCDTLDDVDDDGTIGDAVDRLEDVELSDEIPADAAEGFDALIELFKTLPQDTSGEDLDSGLSDVDPSDLDQEMVTKATAFIEWSDSTCD
ncbi:hypothetical protein [Nocardioides insulae]|uniref:hypothetical protein n=1 Tax=Nocardioides insulae TaxID=394734 RepID=UPI0012FC3B77|nr:hypothetical protein [Nocardioides insulae]